MEIIDSSFCPTRLTEEESQRRAEAIFASLIGGGLRTSRSLDHLGRVVTTVTMGTYYDRDQRRYAVWLDSTEGREVLDTGDVEDLVEAERVAHTRYEQMVRNLAHTDRYAGIRVPAWYSTDVPGVLVTPYTAAIIPGGMVGRETLMFTGRLGVGRTVEALGEVPPLSDLNGLADALGEAAVRMHAELNHQVGLNMATVGPESDSGLCKAVTVRLAGSTGGRTTISVVRTFSVDLRVPTPAQIEERAEALREQSARMAEYVPVRFWAGPV